MLSHGRNEAYTQQAVILAVGTRAKLAQVTVCRTKEGEDQGVLSHVGGRVLQLPPSEASKSPPSQALGRKYREGAARRHSHVIAGALEGPPVVSEPSNCVDATGATSARQQA